MLCFPAQRMFVMITN